MDGGERERCFLLPTPSIAVEVPTIPSSYQRMKETLHHGRLTGNTDSHRAFVLSQEEITIGPQQRELIGVPIVLCLVFSSFHYLSVEALSFL